MIPSQSFPESFILSMQILKPVSLSLYVTQKVTIWKNIKIWLICDGKEKPHSIYIHIWRI
jgi:hypothetical protein